MNTHSQQIPNEKVSVNIPEREELDKLTQINP